jgi:hypothetical protein
MTARSHSRSRRKTRQRVTKRSLARRGLSRSPDKKAGRRGT